MQKRNFTLLELIIVLAMLATIMGMVAPQLSNFLKGRTITEQANSVLALIKYARREAISQARPVEVWYSPTNNKYGLRICEGFAVEDEDGLSFNLPEGIVFELEDKPQQLMNTSDQIIIQYNCDGTLNREYSLESFAIKNRNSHDTIYIQRSANNIDYQNRSESELLQNL